MIDLRSDTVTRPTAEMLEAMISASVGDDVFGDDPSVNALQEKIAEIFGMEAALFCPSGTMANQIALRMLTRPQDEVICDENAHIYLYEGGGLAYNSMLSPKLMSGDRGRLNASQVAAAINPDDIHFPRTRLVSLENTMNKGGGSVYLLDEIRKIREVCDHHHLNLHLDGARMFNALARTGDDPKDYGQLFDAISVCFSKGLGAPVGSALLTTKTLLPEAKRIRQVFGGGMRQAGYLAAACSYALDNHRSRLIEDHQKAERIANSLEGASYIQEVIPPETNIVIAKLEQISPDDYLQKLEEHGVHGVSFGSDAVRFVTHLDFSDNDLEKVINIIQRL